MIQGGAFGQKPVFHHLPLAGDNSKVNVAIRETRS